MHDSPSNFALQQEPRPQCLGFDTRERERVARARAGDRRALRELYTAHNAQVRAHLYRMLGRDCEIDDLTQIVFSRAFTSLDSFKGNSAFSTWLFRITANSGRNLLRQRFRSNRMKTALAWFNAGYRTSGATGTRHLEAHQDVRRILEQLHPNLREVFVLYHYEGLTLHEVGTLLNKPVSTVGDRLARARKRLRALLAS